MSFGWSAGDIAQALLIIVKTVKALDNATGAPAHYREAVSFLGNLRHILEPLQTLTIIGRYPAFGDEICDQVSQIKDPIERFLSIVEKFEPSLGPEAKEGAHRNIRTKLQWRFIESKTVAKFRKQIEEHMLILNSLLHRLILEVLASENDKTREELQRTFTDILDPRLVTLLDDNLGAWKYEMRSSQEIQQQQYKNVISKIQTQLMEHIQPLNTEVITSRQASEGQYLAILAKLQEHDEKLLAVAESLKTREGERAQPKDNLYNNNIEVDSTTSQQPLEEEFKVDNNSSASRKASALSSEGSAMLSAAKSVTTGLSNGLGALCMLYLVLSKMESIQTRKAKESYASNSSKSATKAMVKNEGTLSITPRNTIMGASFVPEQGNTPRTTELRSCEFQQTPPPTREPSLRDPNWLHASGSSKKESLSSDPQRQTKENEVPQRTWVDEYRASMNPIRSGPGVDWVGTRQRYFLRYLNPKSSGSGSSSAQPQEKVAWHETPPTPSPTSFLFVVNGLPLNEDIDNSGIPPRTDGYGRWLPPVYQKGFGAKSRGTVYRWRNGVISVATSYQWAEGSPYPPHGGVLDYYRSITMFYCNPWDQFLVADGDASTRDIETSDSPGDLWHPLDFRHDKGLSRLDFVSEPRLAGNGGAFIDHLGLASYERVDSDAPPSRGLAGNLAILIGLVAFSCRSRDLHNVLIRDRAWHRYRWNGHSRSSGRRPSRGLVVTVYLDAENTEGSTYHTLEQLEWEGGRLLL